MTANPCHLAALACLSTACDPSSVEGRERRPDGGFIPNGAAGAIDDDDGHDARSGGREGSPLPSTGDAEPLDADRPPSQAPPDALLPRPCEPGELRVLAVWTYASGWFGEPVPIVDGSTIDDETALQLDTSRPVPPGAVCVRWVWSIVGETSGEAAIKERWFNTNPTSGGPADIHDTTPGVAYLAPGPDTYTVSLQGQDRAGDVIVTLGPITIHQGGPYPFPDSDPPDARGGPVPRDAGN